MSKENSVMYPARVRSNRKEPVVGFRCSSQAMKENIQKVADAEGKSVNAFLRDLVENHAKEVVDNQPDATMEIYLVEQDWDHDYDVYDSVVVVAESEEEARKIHPQDNVVGTSEHGWTTVNESGELDGWLKRRHGIVWVPYDNIDKLTVTHIGKANADQQKGVLLASFNAG